jgi:hypothetical protein
MRTVTFTACLLLTAGSAARADIVTVPTMEPTALATALNPIGLTINSITIKCGNTGQFGVYTDFINGPVTIHNGVVLSSGSVAALGPLAEAQDPAYDPATPPAAVNSAMSTLEYSGTPEFDAYGATHIENFQGSFDTAGMEVTFTIAEDSQVQFDFIFATVEYPVYTSSFTDAFCVFLDGLAPDNQIAFDHNGNPVQVGASFAGLETTADVNTAFASPHALLHHMTTTTQRLDAGIHTLTFEVSDVNDQVLDSAAFLASLRTGTGTVGTNPSDDCPADLGKQGGLRGDDGMLDNNDFIVFISLFFDHDDDADVGKQGGLRGADGQWDNNDFIAFISLFFNGCTS